MYVCVSQQLIMDSIEGTLAAVVGQFGRAYTRTKGVSGVMIQNKRRIQTLVDSVTEVLARLREVAEEEKKSSDGRVVELKAQHERLIKSNKVLVGKHQALLEKEKADAECIRRMKDDINRLSHKLDACQRDREDLQRHASALEQKLRRPGLVSQPPSKMVSMLQEITDNLEKGNCEPSQTDGLYDDLF